MDRRIWKFSVPVRGIRDLVQFDMPRGARTLSAINQRECLCVYAEVDPKEKTLLKRDFAVFGTGHPVILPPDYKFLGTLVFAMGELVYHVYDLGER